jgi:hypothetical protein
MKVGKDKSDADISPAVKYNSCFADAELKETNNLRYEHDADAVLLDSGLSAYLQEALDKLTEEKLSYVTNCWGPCSGAKNAACKTATATDDTLKTNCPEKASPDNYYYIGSKESDVVGCEKAEDILITTYKETDKTMLEKLRTAGRATK